MRIVSERSKRPWGQYYKFHQEPGVWVKRIEVNPNSRLSLQKHKYRSEKWIVVAGCGLAIVNGNKIPVKPGVVVDVPRGAVHRIGNRGKKKLVMIEVATGKVLTENDIIRIQDDYAR